MGKRVGKLMLFISGHKIRDIKELPLKRNELCSAFAKAEKVLKVLFFPLPRYPAPEGTG